MSEHRAGQPEIHCSSCGTVASAGQRFCGHCGAALSQVCPACQAINPPANHFCGNCGAALSPAAAPVASAAAQDERRWVTVLFADISGFTALSEKMDHEDVKNFADRCSQRVSQVVQRYGGTVVQVVGDETYAVFGAPVAHEDDAERAVRAGLAIAGLNLADDPAKPVRLHVGINTGEAMTGLIGPAGQRDYTVMGDTVNTGARLLAAAQAGTVLVGQQTYRATQQVVRYAELAPIVAKGKDQPVAAWAAQELLAAPRARPLGMTPMIGREAELARLEQMWRRVEQRTQPHLVTLVGEPGIGKSRLVAEFERLLPATVTIWHGRCLPYGEALGYWALATVLKEAASIVAEDEPEAARGKLGVAVAAVMGPEGGAPEVARHLALLSGLDVDADRRGVSADQRVLHASARYFLEAAARQRPLCLVFDDIQWADDSMLDLIEAVVGRAHAVRLMVVTLARPELVDKRAAWGTGVRSFTSLPLDALGEEAERTLMLALIGERGLAGSLVDQFSHQADGNPLYVEELVAMMAESTASGTAAEVPSLIRMLIAARLDSLPAEERIALQRASIFGKVFWEGGLRALVAGPAPEPLESLDALERKDLLRGQARSQLRGDREYIFKHDLIRDVAYDRLPKAERRALHGRAADWLERAAGDQVENYFDQLAHHAVQAGQNERAIEYLMRAAERASRAAAHRQVAALLFQALEISGQAGRPEQLAELHARRGNALVQAGLWAEARPDLEAALAGMPLDSQEQRAAVLFDLATISFWMFDMPGLRRYASEAMLAAESIDRDDIKAGAMAAMTLALSSDGKPDEVVALTGQSLQLAGENPLPVVTFGAAITALNYSWLGRFDEAVVSAQQAIAIARQSKNTQFMTYTMPHLGLALAGQGRYVEAEQVFAEAQRFGREFEIWPMVARAMVMSSGYHFDVFDYAGYEALAQAGRELARSGTVIQTAVSASIDLLFHHIHCRDIVGAKQIISEVAEQVANAQGNHGWLWRLRLAEAEAELALARGDWQETLRLAERAKGQSQNHRRIKYYVFGLSTQAQALAALGRKSEAITAARSAVDLIRPIQSPALFVRAAAGLLAQAGDDALLAEARAAVQRTAAALPNVVMRQRFESAEAVQVIARLSHLV